MVPGFSSNTCVIANSPRSESRKSGATSLTTRDYPISTWPKSTVNNGPPTRSGNPSTTEVDQATRKTAPHRGAGYAIVLEPPPGSAPRPAQWRYRAPSGSATRSISPGLRNRPPSVHQHRRRDASALINASQRPRDGAHVSGRWNQPASVHQHRRRDASATSIAAPFVAPASPRAMEPTRIGTPPSPAGRRRYKHRSALCSARVPAGDGTNPLRYTTIAGGTPALQASQRPL